MAPIKARTKGYPLCFVPAFTEEYLHYRFKTIFLGITPQQTNWHYRNVR